MKAVAIRELKSRLSAYLREVARGEIVLVTDRGRVVAELRRPSAGVAPGAVDQALERLHAEGLVVPGLPQDPSAYGTTRVRLVASTDERVRRNCELLGLPVFPAVGEA